MAATAPAKDTTAPPRFSSTCKADDFPLAEQTRNVHEHLADDETPLDVQLSPGYWQHVIKRLTSRDLIYSQARSGVWLRVFRVLYTDRVKALQLHLLQEFKMPKIRPVHDSGFPHGWHSEFIDPNRMFGVYRDGVLLRDSFQTEQEALDYARTHRSLS